MKKLFTRRKGQPPLPVSPQVIKSATPTATPIVRPASLQPKFVVPSLTHPCPFASIQLLVTSEGLVLLPDTTAEHPTSHVRIPWGKEPVIEEIEGDPSECSARAMVPGLIGLLTLFHASYLLVVTSRSEVGNLFDELRTVYRVDGVSAIPLEETRATAAVNMLASIHPIRSHVLTPMPAEEDLIEGSDIPVVPHTNGASLPLSPHVTFSSTEHASQPTTLSMPGDPDILPLSSAESSGRSSPTSSFPSSPVGKALVAQLSFWNRLAKRPTEPPIQPPELQSPSTETVDSFDRHVSNGAGPTDMLKSIMAPPPTSVEERHSELDEKIVRETIKEFTKGGMYFSYNFDITTSLQRKQQQSAKLKRQSNLFKDLQALDEQPRVSISSEETELFSEPHENLPLWRRVDRKFWWNEALMRGFVERGLHSYVLPVMQGYYQIATFRIPAPYATTDHADHADHAEEVSENGDSSKDLVVDYVIVSRRSRDRAGLRYQRRGIDDEANVANFVETETIMRVLREGRSNIFSYIQIRGSIPLFWTQPGYGLKPLPQLSKDRTEGQNIDVMKRHFARTVSVYGPVTIINLAEQHGKEAIVTVAYKETVEQAGLRDVRYHEYDFHAETKGMRYENISKLIMQLERNFESQGFFWVSSGIVMSQQKGVFRVNCIDCLDRTNVVQSAFARYVLQNQLEAVAVQNAYESGDRSDPDVVFNDVWANNGDAISRAYAGTSALKGDFTRTGKRDISGLFNDGLNSLSRVYTSTFSDWFCQAVIDYFLGNRTLSVFSEFLSKLSSTDPGELIRISKIRAAAIETCGSRVLFEGEKQIAGWTLFSPVEMNVRLSDKFEEKVLLLTAKALYVVSYDYNLDQVKLFTRIPLGDIINITKGLYILSPLEEASRNPDDNYGFLISYLPSRLTTRISSYSVRNTVQATQPTERLKRLLSGSTKNSAALSRIISNVAVATGAATGDVAVAAAFKALPVDNTRHADGDVDDPVMSATTCRGAVDVIVDTLRMACNDIGGIGQGFVVEKDIVTLAEAQRMTTVFAKWEYNFKRLLWLGS
ncbi:SacI homology domain-containing protein [Hysterangium stoloniferum]|nr:SacI homology domain-containing protein [Hysterangium stoloniferum]